MTMTFSWEMLYFLEPTPISLLLPFPLEEVDDQNAWKVVWAHKLWRITLMIQTSFAESIRWVGYIPCD
jgi:hypothetical protein